MPETPAPKRRIVIAPAAPAPVNRTVEFQQNVLRPAQERVQPKNVNVVPAEIQLENQSLTDIDDPFVPGKKVDWGQFKQLTALRRGDLRDGNSTYGVQPDVAALQQQVYNAAVARRQQRADLNPMESQYPAAAQQQYVDALNGEARARVIALPTAAPERRKIVLKQEQREVAPMRPPIRLASK
ncbi:hypothetical protein [Hymenobacter koreensis]|uniref:Uncharacterized protein n=1 Tax=Hymenobacter koreensis TaxID=1084523 RepID=A0ABP8JJB9_9BACT